MAETFISATGQPPVAQNNLTSSATDQVTSQQVPSSQQEQKPSSQDAVYKVIKPMQNLQVSHSEHFKVESAALMADVASTSHATFGNFILNSPNTAQTASGESQQQIAFLRALNTVELYRKRGAEGSLELVTTYKMPNVMCISMEKLTIDVRQSIYESASQVTSAKKNRRQGHDSGADGLYQGAALGEDDEEDEDDYMDVRTKDLLVLHLPELKFLLLEFDSSVCEFGTYSLFNFDQSEELKVTGKRFPKQGMLRCISTSSSLSGFGFLADDSLFCWVQLQDVQDLANNNLDNISSSSGGRILAKNRKQQKLSMGNLAKKTSGLELSKRQSSQMWPGDTDDKQPAQGVISSIQLSERYMNAMSGDPNRVQIEHLFKPLEVFQMDKYDIQFIVDIQLVEQKTSQTITLLVLFKGDIDKMVGTKARYPVTRLAIFQLQQGNSQAPLDRQNSAEESKTQQETASQILKYVMTIDALPFYANQILLSASTSDDFCFLLTPYSFLLVRFESNRVTEVFTSTLGVTIREKFKEDRSKMFFPQQTATERSCLEDNMGQELKLDGTCRLLPLPGRRILILTEKGTFTILTIRYDQAEIYIAEVSFQSLVADEKLVGSSLCYSSIGDNVIDVFVSSHFHDATLFRLKTVTDADKITQLTDELFAEDQATSEKRQRLNSSEQHIVRRRKNFTFYEPLVTLDSLTIVSPITDAVQIPSIAGVDPKSPQETRFSMDFLIGSGNQVKSYLTFAAAQIPLIDSQMPLTQLVPSTVISDRLRILRVLTFKDQFIIVNYKEDKDEAAIRTSLVHIDMKTKKLVQLGVEQMEVCYDQETLACFPLDKDQDSHADAMVQVCPRSLRVVTTEEKRRLVASTAFDEGSSRRVMTAGFDPKTQTLFTLETKVRQNGGSSQTLVKACRGSKLQPCYEGQLGSMMKQITALSVTTVASAAQAQGAQQQGEARNLLVLATETNDCLIYDVKDDHLMLVFQCAGINQQPAILPNQMRCDHESLLSRAFTDLSVDISNCFAAMSGGHTTDNVNQVAFDQRLFNGAASDGPQNGNTVRELKLWYPEQAPAERPVLIALMADASIMIYQNMPCFEGQAQEKFRFKLVDSHVLIRPKTAISPSDQTHSRQFIHIEGKMALVLHPAKTFGAFIRHGRPVLVDIGKQQGANLVDLTPFRTGFLAIDEDMTAVRSVKFAQRFDPRVQSLKLTDGYFLKQVLFKDRGIKKIKLFSPNVVSTNPEDNAEMNQEQSSRDFIFLATYEHKTPENIIANDGFAPETRAPSIFYTLEVLRMPKSGGQWAEFKDQFLLDKVIKYNFQENDVINQLEQITLRSTTDDFKNYLAVASMRIDTSLKRRGAHAQRQDDEGFYSSALHIFQVDLEQNKLEVCLLENYKRSITCISSYLGNLIATMKNLKLQDLVFIMYKFNNKEKKLIQPQPIPNGVQNLATSISFDGDFIIIGDAYKNLNLLKKCDEEDNKQERQESSGLINFKKVMSNKIEAKVIGAYSLNKKLALTQLDQALYCQNGVMSHQQVIPLTEIQKKLFTVLGASFDGYVRLYKIKETKNLEIVAQLNVMDKILNTVPLELNSFKRQKPEQPSKNAAGCQLSQELVLSSTPERKIALVTQRNGIQIVSTCSELEFRAEKSLMELVSKVLPSKGCLTPMHSHLTPTTFFNEKSSVYQRTNQNAINYSKSLYLYWFLSETQKQHIASKIGFTVTKLESFLLSQRFNVPADTSGVTSAATNAATPKHQQAEI